MKMKRWSVLLLSVLLLLAVLPGLLPAAQATAVGECPASSNGRHRWTVWTVDRPGTCVLRERRKHTCKSCGKTAYEYFDYGDHAWDEGVVTKEPEGFTPGIRTFTCRHDSSHTYTEEIDPSPWLFAMLSGATVDFSIFDQANRDLALTIIEQPVGGSITRYEGDTHTMHVTAVGGTGAYTYEWHSRAQEVGLDEQYNDLLKWFVGLFGVTPEQVDAALRQSFSNTDTLTVSTANEDYYCVVTDSAGNTAESDRAHVAYKVRIAREPANVNLQVDYTVPLSCEAADGSGSYSYVWYNSDGEEVGTGNPLVLPLTVGNFYCVVTDDVTGETATSQMCTAYSTAPFRLVSITEDCEALPDEDMSVIASFTGGVEEYEIWWDKDGTAIPSVEGYDGMSQFSSRADVDGEGVYTVHAVDSMLATLSASVTVTVPKLTIVEQPKGGTIPKGGYVEVRILVDGGEGPYHYALYRNDQLYITGSNDSPTYMGKPYGFRPYHPGNYYFIVEDSKGRTCTSDTVTLEELNFRITSQTESASLAKPGDTAALFVEAAGGVEPYTYLWSYKRGNTRYKVGEARTHSADKPGEYLCRVVDADGNMIHSKEIQVGYTGDEPIITTQPTGGLLTGASFYIYCDAVTGSGGELRFDWERSPTGVRPSWSNVFRRGTSSKSVDATEAGTYRCKVTDTKTGKYTYTQPAFLAEGLRVIADVDMIRYWGRVGDMEAHVKITGGTAPYTVKLYVVAMTWTEDGRTTGLRTILYRERTANTPEEAEDVVFNYAPYQEMMIKENGEWKRYTDYYQEVYVVVTDAEGESRKVYLKKQ